MKSSPIFITGIYRSGSTLLTRILDAHPELAITYETVHFMRFCFNKYNPLTDDNIKQLLSQVNERIYKRHGLSFKINIVMDILKNEQCIDNAAIYNALMKTLFILDTDATRWGEKTLVAWKEIPNFLEMFPNGKTIITIRDPRAVLCSFKNFTHEPEPNYLDSIFAYLDLINTIIDYQKKIPKNSLFVFKYEDLLDNPDGYCKKICDFLQIEFLPHMLDFNRYKDRQGNNWKGNSSFVKNINMISTSFKDIWKEKIFPEDLLLLESILNDKISKIGYPLFNKRADHDLVTKMFDKIKQSDLIKERFCQWILSSRGVQSYPSDPTNKKNWNKETAGCS
ncbi:sulfotransferase domain protein [Candidatus Magnetomorum sp. HK-1]|nr:sulfotransferase domain protein [Candidatus Magnetomorum sp. HK-1]